MPFDVIGSKLEITFMQHLVICNKLFIQYNVAEVFPGFKVCLCFSMQEDKKFTKDTGPKPWGYSSGSSDQK